MKKHILMHLITTILISIPLASIAILTRDVLYAKIYVIIHIVKMVGSLCWALWRMRNGRS